MYNFCTISTLSHLYKVYALYESIKSVSPDVKLWVLLVDNGAKELESNLTGGVVLMDKDVFEGKLTDKVISKYKSNNDKLRWTLKPFFLKYLLIHEQLEKVIYVDNDIAFFGVFDFLFDELDNHPILLTPHFYPRNPLENQNWLEANFRVGLFNAGFFGVNAEGLDVLQWWGGCCYYRCEKNYMRGLFDDQKYLDLVPVIEPRTKILEHKGCNIAGWNVEICSRDFNPETKELLIDNKWQVVFIHFNPITLRILFNGDDPHLMPYLEKYVHMLKLQKPDVEIEDQAHHVSFIESLKLYIWKVLNRLNN